MTDAAYCLDQVRRYDRDRFLTLIFAPEEARPHLAALYAFNLEIAKTREIVSEPMIGQMRLQWWRDALDRLYEGENIAHEVARPLGHAIRAAHLDRTLFDRLIDAREQDLEDAPPPNVEALEAYGQDTTAPLIRLAYAVLNGDTAESAAAVAGHVGRAWALIGLVRAIPFHAAQRRCYLPQDMLAAADVAPGRLFDFKPGPGLNEIARHLAIRATDLLTEARQESGSVPRSARSPLLLATLADQYLADLARAEWNPFDPASRREHPLAALRLWSKSARGVF